MLRYPGLREAASCTLEELEDFVRGFPPRSRVLLAGMVEDVARKPTRSGGMMARFTLSDETGALEAVVFGRAYEGVSPKLKEDTPLLVLAEVEREEGGLRVIAQAVWTHEEVWEAAKALEVEVDHALLDEKGVALLKGLLDEHPGPLPLYVRVQGPFGEALFALREARVGEEALRALEAEGFRAYLVPDREAFLEGGNGGGREEAVPFRATPGGGKGGPGLPGPTLYRLGEACFYRGPMLAWASMGGIRSPCPRRLRGRGWTPSSRASRPPPPRW